MKKKIQYFVFFLLITGCHKIVEIDLPKLDKKPVVNCLFTDSEPLKVHLSLTKAADTESYLSIDDATVSVFADDKLLAVLPSIGAGTYLDSTFYPESGRSYSLQIGTPGYGEIEVEDDVPEFGLHLINNDFRKNAGTDDSGYNYSELQLKIRDIDSEPNYYGIAILGKEDDGNYYPLQITSNDTKITSEMMVDDYPEILVFRDVLFNASETTITVKFFYNIATRLRLFTFSKAAFNYLKTLTIHNYTKDYDFWEVYEPISVYSNIENGYGIFAGYSSRDYEIEPDSTVTFAP